MGSVLIINWFFIGVGGGGGSAEEKGTSELTLISVAQVEEEENYPVVNSRHPKSVVPEQVRQKLTFHTSNQPAVLRPNFLS